MTAETLNKVRCLFDVPVPMRDGINLSADIFLPAEAGPYPAILMRTCYDNTTERHVSFCEYFAARGYVFVFQDVRGRGDSEGRFIPFVHEGEDGFDTIEWIAGQPWCNGRVGMMGGSYLGTAQWLAAREHPPHLVTLVSSAAAGRWGQEVPFMNGKLLLNMLTWLNSIGGRTSQPTLGLGAIARHYDWKQILFHTPLCTADELIGRTNTVWREWLSHPAFDAYWQALSLEGHFEALDLPVLHITGWYDGDQPGALYYYNRMVAQSPAADRQFLLAGPWHHAGVWFPEQSIGGIDFTEAALHDAKAVHLRWFDSWLKGIDSGLLDGPRVKVFAMGRNQWQEAPAWPLPATQMTPYYLHSGGRANTAEGDGRLDAIPPGDEPADTYTYDPHDPTPSDKDYGLSEEPFALDRRYAEAREDVLVYSSAPLEHALEVTGVGYVVLYAATDAVDTDFAAVLAAVHPDGRSVPLAEGILRASYRDFARAPQPIQPGRVYEYRIELNATSNVFLPGHRLRIEVMSCHFPKYDRNPNSGDPVGAEQAFRPARQTIRHDAAHPSHALLPVIPAR